MTDLESFCQCKNCNILNDLSEPSICISYAPLATSNSDILTVFKKLKWGKINSVEFVICNNKVSGEKFYKIFIHFSFIVISKSSNPNFTNLV